MQRMRRRSWVVQLGFGLWLGAVVVSCGDDDDPFATGGVGGQGKAGGSSAGGSGKAGGSSGGSGVGGQGKAGGSSAGGSGKAGGSSGGSAGAAQGGAAGSLGGEGGATTGGTGAAGSGMGGSVAGSSTAGGAAGAAGAAGSSGTTGAAGSSGAAGGPSEDCPEEEPADGESCPSEGNKTSCEYEDTVCFCLGLFGSEWDCEGCPVGGATEGEDCTGFEGETCVSCDCPDELDPEWDCGGGTGT